jgi:hypothetical protein
VALIERSHKKSFNPVALLLLVALIGSLAFGGYYFKQYQDLKTSSSKPADQANKELVNKVNKVYQLPQGEFPIVALVDDEAKFITQYPVFTAAKKGDNLLLYEKAGQAILYRPSDNKVVGTANFAVKKTARVYIVAPAVAQASTEQDITTKLGLTVAGKSTPVSPVAQTLVIDTSGSQAESAALVAKQFGGTVVTTLPIGEKTQDNADIMLFIASAQPAAAQPTPVTE